MPRSKRNAIILLFATGLVCIVFACLRVTQVAINAAKPEADGQPLDPTWLAIWGMVECSIGASDASSTLYFLHADTITAVIIGCCPAFAVLINSLRTRVTYDSQGYRRQTNDGSGPSENSKVQLRTLRDLKARERDQRLGLQTGELHWADAHSSQEQLKASHDGILVSTTVVQSGGKTNKVDMTKQVVVLQDGRHDIDR